MFGAIFRRGALYCEVNFRYQSIPELISASKRQGGKEIPASPGGTLGIYGWGCATWTVEPLACTRASSAEFYYTIRVHLLFNDKNKRKELNTTFRWLHVLESSKLCVQFLSLVCIIRFLTKSTFCLVVKRTIHLLSCSHKEQS